VRDELSRTTGKRMGKKWQNYRGYRYPPATGTEYRYLTTFLQNVLVVEQIFLPYQYILQFYHSGLRPVRPKSKLLKFTKPFKKKAKSTEESPFLLSKMIECKSNPYTMYTV